MIKDRKGLQIIDGFRPSSGKLRSQRAMGTQGISSIGEGESVACLLSGQVGSSLVSGLKASEQRLSAMVHDRSRIGRELHDSVLHALYSIRLVLEQTPEMHHGVVQAVARLHDQAVDQLDTLIQGIRRMILSVESDPVDPFRLISDLQTLAQAIEQVSEVRIRVGIDPAAEEVLTSEEARELVTITREALSNCVRHANATRVVIALRHVGSRVQFSIRDNGSGFDAEPGAVKGAGFARMEERIRKIGGRLNVQSKVGQGTCITAYIYLEPMLTTV